MIHRIVQFALQQRFLVLMVTALIIIAGVVSFQRMPVDAYPDLSPPMVEPLYELQQGFMPFLMGVYSSLDAFTAYLPQMFWPSVWCALVALVGASSLWLMRHLARPDHPADAA